MMPSMISLIEKWNPKKSTQRELSVGSTGGAQNTLTCLIPEPSGLKES